MDEAKKAIEELLGEDYKMSPSVKSSLSLDLVDPTLKPTGSTTTTTSTGLRPNTSFLDVASKPSSSKILTLTGPALKHKQGTTSTTTTTETKKPVSFPDQVYKETYFLSFPDEHNYEQLKITYQYLTLLSQQKILSKGITIRLGTTNQSQNFLFQTIQGLFQTTLVNALLLLRFHTYPYIHKNT